MEKEGKGKKDVRKDILAIDSKKSETQDNKKEKTKRREKTREINEDQKEALARRMTWETFRTKFLEKYFPRSERHKKRDTIYEISPR